MAPLLGAFLFAAGPQTVRSALLVPLVLLLCVCSGWYFALLVQIDLTKHDYKR